MLDTFLYCVNAVVPVFAMVVIGKLLAAKDRLSDGFFRDLNGLVYKWLIPAVLFESIYTADLTSSFDLKLLLICFGGTFAVFLLSLLLARRFLPGPLAGSFSQGCFKGNYLLLAVPLIENILGADELTKALVIAPFMVIEFNFLGVLVFTICGERTDQPRGLRGFAQKLWVFVKNPFILAVLLALPFSLLQLRLPQLLAQPIAYIADMGTPIALIGVGGVMGMGMFRKTFRLALLSSLIKTVFVPLVMVLLSIALGLRGTELGIVTILYAAPAAANAYTTALELGGDADLAANNLVMTTAMSAVSIVLFMTALLRLGLV